LPGTQRHERVAAVARGRAMGEPVYRHCWNCAGLFLPAGADDEICGDCWADPDIEADLAEEARLLREAEQAQADRPDKGGGEGKYPW
jgi:hypothetical protein